MFNSKKGVSEVVANVLIVLLVIVGIAVIWSVVKPTIDKGAAGIQADCFTVSVEPISCVPGSTEGQWNVVVKRNPGAGEFDSVDLVFENANEETQKVVTTPVASDTTLSELSTLTVVGTTSSTFDAISVNTVVVSGGQLCQITTQPIDC
ncbi:MAG: hypothetical protein AABX23_01495 [Nanoarchaeota archaeon]